LKTIGIHQPNFIPWIGYFVKVAKSNTFVLLDNVQYTKGGFSNRVKIKNKNGEGAWITVPLKATGGHFKNINEIQVDYNRAWQKDIENKLRDYYKKAPFINETIEIFSWILNKGSYSSLSALNCTLLFEIFMLLEIRTEIKKASEMNLPAASNNELLIAIIKNCGGDVYLAGLGGKKYMDENLYHENNISIIYNTVTEKPYPQVNGRDFIPNLSVIDMMFNIGIDETKKTFRELCTGQSVS